MPSLIKTHSPGIASRHGPHQVPQKSKTTTLPLKSPSETFLPLRSGSVNLKGSS